MDVRQIVVRFLKMAKNFSLFQSVQTGSGAHPSLYVMSAGGCTQGVKSPDRQTEHSVSSRVEVKPLKTKINLNYI